MTHTEHTFDPVDDRCICGGEWVYFEGYGVTFGYACETDSPCDLCGGLPRAAHEADCPDRRLP